MECPAYLKQAMNEGEKHVSETDCSADCWPINKSSLTSSLKRDRTQRSPEISCLQAQQTSMSFAWSIFRSKLLRAKLSKGAPFALSQRRFMFK